MTSLQGLRVLVVEDEGPIAMMIEDMLQDMGCVIAASVATVADALARVAAGGLDFALLDFNLGGKSAEPVAHALLEKGIPFAVGSGYGRAGLPESLQNLPVIQKPFLDADLEKIIRESLPRA